MKLDGIGKLNGELKPKQEWDKVDNEGNEVNVQALFSMFNDVSPDKFHKITTWKSEKVLIMHEGTSTMKLSKIKMFIVKFENIRMKDHETFSNFYLELSYIVNSSFNIRDKILK